MKLAAFVMLLAGLIVLSGCAPVPAAAPADIPQATTAAATVSAATPTAAPAAGATVAPAATAQPATVAPAATATPAATGAAAPTAPATAASTATAAAASAQPAPGPAPTVPPGFTTHRDPEAGLAIDYPEGWSLLVPDAELRRQAQGYTASLRSVSPQSEQPRGQALPAGAAGIDVTVYRTQAKDFDAVVAERRAEILNSEVETKITSEEFLTLSGGLRAVRWQLESAQAGTVAELTTLLGGKRIMIDGMGDLSQFDAVARSLRPLGTAPSASSAVSATPAADGGQTYTDAGLGFSVVLPADYELKQDTGLSRLFWRKSEAGGGPSFPRFYLTVLPSGFTNQDVSAYNFISEEGVKALMALKVGESYAANGTPGYSTFTRLPDTTVSGLPGVVIENARVWEGTPNTRDRRVLVKGATGTYMFGTYYVSAEQLEQFEQVLAGTKITAQ